ncbi:MAG: hypothetical protein ACPG4Z_00270 [Chitinophagales bacterium]
MGNDKLGIGSKVEHPKFGLGVIVGMDNSFYKIYFTSQDEVKELARGYDRLEIVEKAAMDFEPMTARDIEQAVENVMQKYQDRNTLVELGSKWVGGTMILNPGSDDLQSKEIPISTFFHKIVMLRDRLRVLEQNINSHKVMTDEEKVHIQQYITRAYGSLTSFNVLFADKENHFKGAGRK